MAKKKKDIFADIESYSKSVSVDTWEGSMREFIPMVQANPKLGQLSHARVLDMIESAGVEFDPLDKNKQDPRYKFFEGDLYGVGKQLRKFVKYLKAAASGSQVGRRILLMYGPTSSGKSQLATLLKNGLEEYTKTKEGALYAIGDCPIHENPLNAVPNALRKKFREDYGIKIDTLARLCPVCRLNLGEKYNDNWLTMPVKRVFISEDNRLGIGTFLPGDTKCVSGDTMILTSNGLEEIGSIVGEREESDISALVYDMHGDLQKASKSFRYDNKDVVDIKTNTGHTISCTFNHPLMTVNSDGNFVWQNAGRFTENDTVVMSLGMNENFNKVELPNNDLGITEVSDNLALFFGLYIAEGYIDKKNKFVELTNTDKNIQGIIRDTAKELGLEKNYHLYNNMRNMICSVKLSRTMRQLGFKSGSALEKDIPQCVFNSGKITKVLLGMWLGDGNCGRHASKNTNEAIYGTASKVLAQQVHLLLSSIGVPSTKRYCPDIGTSGQYVIKVSGQRVKDLVYKLNIPIWKMTRPIIDVDSNDNLLIMPNINNLVENSISNIAELNGKWYRYKKSDIKPYGRRLTGVSMSQLIYSLEKHEVDTDKFNKINSDKFFYAKIQTIGKSKKDVYDIEVPNGHNFIANGFVSHNSQSLSELVGSVDFSKLGEYGVESDPRAYKFDGELNVANRGMIEMIEMLKVDPKFLYVLLTLAQEKTIKTERFPLIYADEFILSHTNESEYRRFLGDKKLEALHDRIIVCRFPYNLKVDEEIKIYDKLLVEADFGGVHVSPLTLKVASMFAVLSRLSNSKDQNLTTLKKMQLYNGEDVEGFTKDDLKNIQSEDDREGMDGVSPRYIFNCVADCFTKYDLECVTPIDLLRSIKENFENNAKLTKDDIERFDDLLTIVVEEYTKLAKTEVQKAFFLSFEQELTNLLNNYVDNVGAFLDNTSVEDEFGDSVEPNERLMRSIEEKIGVSEAGKESFRQEIYRKVMRSRSKDGDFDITTVSKLKMALQLQMFDERADVIRLTISTRNPDAEELQKLNQVIDTLVKKHGYTAASANKLLRYVSSLMARTT